MWDFFVEGMGLALRWDTFAAVSVGLLLGMFVGALPGFTTLMAMAILLLLSFFVHPLIGQTVHRCAGCDFFHLHQAVGDLAAAVSDRHIPDQVLHSLIGLGVNIR